MSALLHTVGNGFPILSFIWWPWPVTAGGCLCGNPRRSQIDNYVTFSFTTAIASHRITFLLTNLYLLNAWALWLND